MAEYVYKALDKSGNETEGTVHADVYQDAVSQVRTLGLYPIDIHKKTQEHEIAVTLKKRNFLLQLFAPKVRRREIVAFVSDLAVLTDAGMPLVRSLEVLSRQRISRKTRQVIEQVRTDVEGGLSLSQGLAKQPYCFSQLFINMVRAGEIGGVLSEVLDRLAVLYEKSARLTSKLRASLTYPFFILFFAMLVVIFIVGCVVPRFFVIFADIQATLPLPTRILYGLSMFLQKYWGILIGIMASLALGISFLLTLYPVKYFIDGRKLRLPIFGELYTKVSVSGFCRTFGTLLRSGVPILQTLTVAKDATGNVVFSEAIDKVKNSIKEGESVAEPLSQCGLFPVLVTNMIMVGEETGTLPQMLVKIANRYDDEVDTLVAQLTSLIEPVMIVSLAIIVGFIVISLFLPLVSVVQSLTAL